MPALHTGDRASEPRPFRWRKWLVRGLVAGLLIVGVGVGCYAYYRHRLAADLAAYLADLDRTDPGWRRQDIEAARAIVPDAENAATVAEAAFRTLPKGWSSPYSTVSFDDLPPETRLDDADGTRLRDELNELQIALREARKLADLPKGRYPTAYEADVGQMRFGSAQHMRLIVSLLELDVLSQAQDGDLKGALLSCRALLNAGRSLGDEPLFISQLTRVTAAAIACRVAERVLAQGEPDADELLRLQHGLEEEERFPRLSVAFRGWRAEVHEALAAIESGEISLADFQHRPPTGNDRNLEFLDRDRVLSWHPQILAFQTEAVQLALLPDHERAQPVRALELRLSKHKGAVNVSLPGTVTLFDSIARRSDGQLRCVITALAAERYRRKHGRMPESLAKLVPDFLSAVPLDPEDGKLLRLHQRPDRMVVYSVYEKLLAGGDRDHYDPDEPSPPGVGTAVHLFDVPHRRQPPRPKPAIGDDDPQ